MITTDQEQRDAKSVASDRFEELPAFSTSVMPTPWPAFLVRRAEIEEEVQRLSQEPRAKGGRRASEIVHPASRSSFPGMAPGLSVSINVLNPGETITCLRDNASRVEIGLSGEGRALIGHETLPLAKWSVWTSPSMIRRQYRCDGTEPLVWLSYSNVPLLKRIHIYYADDKEAMPRAFSEFEEKYVREGAPDIPVLDGRARLRGYEYLTDIPVIENKALVWPWDVVDANLASEEGDGKRGIFLLYNPATERRAGTTHSFFATLGRVTKHTPVPSRGHKHSSFACNYHLMGHGSSIVDNELIEWEAGDLLFSAPSWSEHAHGSRGGGAAAFTVQDHPLQIAMESLIWQEKMGGPILTLGSEPGQTGYVGPRLEGD